MHTLKVMGAGFLLLAGFLLVGRWMAGPSPAVLATGARLFVPVWLVAAAVNLWFGVARAGYSLADEVPVFLLVFALPAAAALGLWWRFKPL
jgi:hypothetical protein